MRNAIKLHDDWYCLHSFYVLCKNLKYLNIVHPLHATKFGLLWCILAMSTSLFWRFALFFISKVESIKNYLLLFQKIDRKLSLTIILIFIYNTPFVCYKLHWTLSYQMSFVCMCGLQFPTMLLVCIFCVSWQFYNNKIAIVRLMC